ncbi:MAG TPA: glutamate synthase subunit beta [Campylobacterales bacterium]|nr:glutamate synthase subunit beta [Campylobacterales bacterium]
MQNFLSVDRIEPQKRLVGERIRDFDEVYLPFNKLEARTQSERCVQCGDPYCMNKCPLHNFIPQWLKSVAEANLELAFKLSNESSPFPEIMGRVCPHDTLCEGDCTLNDGHGAITIGSIERYITEKGFSKGLKIEFSSEKIGKSVGIIGSGPAGLSLATYLLRAGIDVTIYERASRAGGLLTYGIPGFKLDKSVVQKRIDMLLEAGLNLKTNCEVGKDISFDEVRNSHDAIFIGIGATKARRANIENEDSDGVYMAMEFLTNIQKKLFGEEFDSSIDVSGKNVIVIGGGDTAMDCIRTAIREGAKSVTCHYRRDDNNMPGSYKEYRNAIEEGARFEFFSTPKKIEVEDGKVKGVIFAKTELSERDETGRQRVIEIPDSEISYPADVVIMALGFEPAKPKFLEESGIELNSWGGIVTSENGETSIENIYSGGDAVRGADLVVRAVLDGREVAKHIIKKLTSQ